MMALLRYCNVSILILTIYASAVKRVQYAVSNQNFAITVEIDGAMEMANYSNVIVCGAHCAYNSKFVTFLNNNNTGQCILHLKDFIFTKPSILEIGWKYYVARGVAVRCPDTYLCYKYLDFCYRVYSLATVAFPQITTTCNRDGGRLAAIKSEEKEGYFRYILGKLIYDRVAVGGDRVNASEWRLYNGSLLTYFNWMPGEPSSNNSLCLQLKGDFKLYDCACSGGQDRIFVCEI